MNKVQWNDFRNMKYKRNAYNCGYVLKKGKESLIIYID